MNHLPSVSLFPSSTNRTAGQALLLVILAVGAVLVTGLSVVARSVSDINLTSRDDEAKRAFSAAEAGIEKALSGSGTTGTLTNNSSFTVNIGPSETGGLYRLPDLSSGESGTVWFVSHDPDTGYFACGSSQPCLSQDSTFQLCWGSPGADAASPAMELSVFYNYVAPPATAQTILGANPDFRNIKTTRAVFDPEESRRSANYFDGAVITTAGNPGQCDPLLYKYRTADMNFDIPCRLTDGNGCLLMARLKLLYNQQPQPVAFGTAGTLPSQGIKIASSGISGSANRKIEVIETYPDPLSIFDYGVFTQYGIEGK